MRVLFVTPEVYPIIKVGGLADVAASLPHALRKIGVDIRIVMPLYRAHAGYYPPAHVCLRPYVPGLDGRVPVT